MVRFACVCAYICVCVCFLQLGPWTLTGLSLFRVCEHCWHTHFFPQKVTLSPIGKGLLRTHTDNFSKAMQIWHCVNSTFCNMHLKNQFIQITKKTCISPLTLVVQCQSVNIVSVLFPEVLTNATDICGLTAVGDFILFSFIQSVNKEWVLLPQHLKSYSYLHSFSNFPLKNV